MFDGDGYPLSDERLDEIETYELECINNSKEGLKLNGRFVLSMIRELRALRQFVKATRAGLWNLELVEMNSKNPHEERWHKITIGGEITEEGIALGQAWPGDPDYRFTTLIVKSVNKFGGEPISYRALSAEFGVWRPHSEGPKYYLSYEDFEIAAKILKFSTSDGSFR